MTTLLNDATGPAEASETDHASCGRLSSDWCLANLALAPDNAPDNATAAQLDAAVQAADPTVQRADAPADVDIDAWVHAQLALGNYVEVGVLVDSLNCVPDVNGSAWHWIAVYGDDGGVFSYWNCWYATKETVPSLTPFYNNGYVGAVAIGPPPIVVISPQGEDMADILTLDWTTSSKGTHDFAVVNGSLHHDWEGDTGTGETITGQNNELQGVQLTEVTGLILQTGVCRLQVRDGAGHCWRVYQGPTESVWHVQGLY